jgi:hypothetical protein
MRLEPHHTERKNKKRWVVYYDLQNGYLTTALPLARMQILKVCHETMYQDDPARPYDWQQKKSPVSCKGVRVSHFYRAETGCNEFRSI